MSTTTHPLCAACGRAPATQGPRGLGVLCSEHWTAVPNNLRKRLEQAQRDLGKRPTARVVRDEHDLAVAAVVAAASGAAP